MILLSGTNMVSTGIVVLVAACRGFWSPRKTTGKFKLNADNYSFALAA